MAATKVQLINGHWQDSEGNVLALGSLKMVLVQDEQLSSSAGQICGGITLTILLDANGNVQGTSGDGFPTQSVWPTDQMNPLGASYTVTAYSAAGELAWGPNYNLLVPSGATFDVDNWVPNSSFVAAASGSGGTVLEVNGTPNVVQGLLNLESANSSVTITDLGNGTVNLEAAGSSITLKTNGVLNGSQTLLNLLNGSGVSVTVDGSGDVTISMVSPPVVGAVPQTTQSTVTATGSGPTDVGANKITTMILDIYESTSFDEFSLAISSPGAGTNFSDFGLYDTLGNLLANSGPVLNSSITATAGVFTFAMQQGTVNLNPGRYVFAMTSNGTGAGGDVGPDIDVGEPLRIDVWYQCTGSSTAGALPSTITLVAKFGLGPSVNVYPGISGYPIIYLG
jgi:hypothetical protein